MRDYTVLYLDTSGDEWTHKSQVVQALSAEKALRLWEASMEAGGRPVADADWHPVRVISGAYKLTPLGAANDQRLNEAAA